VAANYKLDEVVREYLIESGEPEAKRFRYQQHGIACLREMNMDFSGSPSVVTLPVNDLDSVVLPPDYINYTKIGVCDFNGNIVQMGLNEDMKMLGDKNDCGSYKTIAESCRCGNDRSCSICNGQTNPSNCGCGSNCGGHCSGQNPVNGCGGGGCSGSCGGTCAAAGGFGAGYTGTGFYGALIPGWGWDGYSDNFRNGEILGRFFGVGGGNSPAGYFKVNNNLGVIQLQNRCGNQIILEYIADISLTNGDINVHPFLIFAIKRYIAWASIVDNMSIPEGAKQGRLKDYNLARRQAIKRFNSSNQKEWLDALRRYNMAAPRF
jgi:hypothetical protein